MATDAPQATVTLGAWHVTGRVEPGSDDHDRLVLLDMAVARTSPTAP